MFTVDNNPIKTRLYQHGSCGGVVQAFHENCEGAFCFVTYAKIGTDFVITDYSVHARATEKEAQAAGDLIDAVLEKEAWKHGIRQLLIVHPHHTTAEFVRDYKAHPFMREVGCKTTPVYVN